MEKKGDFKMAIRRKQRIGSDGDDAEWKASWEDGRENH